MNLFEIRNMFFLFLKQFNDDDIHALMNFLELVLLNYKKEPSKFVGLCLKSFFQNYFSFCNLFVCLFSTTMHAIYIINTFIFSLFFKTEIINTNITTSLSESFVDKFYENFECQNENEDLFSDNCTKPCCSCKC